MSDETQKIDKTGKPSGKKEEQQNSSTAANWGFAAGGFIAGAAASSAFAMSGGNDDNIIETDVIEPEPNPEDDNQEELIIDTEPDVQENVQEDVSDNNQDNIEVEQPDTSNSLPHYTDAPVAHVSDSQSFAQAFADARHQVGPGGIFEWHGQVYGTYYADEWNSMSQDQRNDYWASVNAQSAHDEDWNPHSNTHQDVVTHDHDNSNLMATNEEHIDNDPAPRVEVGQIVSQEGVTMAEVSLDGEPMLVADTDNDGVIDTVAADFDGDGQLSDYEIVSTQEVGLDIPIDIADLQEMSGEQQVDDPTMIADVQVDQNDYQPGGFEEMIAMEDNTIDDFDDGYYEA